ncbi:tRNA (N(6)-L-threonylcarbamoyladenosine(37)-C(2))-methylthiotransferase MtaB [Candidatus Izimaplasma bacterium ZiA1]|uniref:tRNA (N(6)-L-threonylcarbamoyladenosine(37)-C(2))- methylthiotransferase MtaB n=1 Tax=Candidatus Izimoplasma sp. ZiA1 TaxID=2024899 RepID=UPI000BAA930C|nr:tRNA (N(6)-L-threonylcarbamoyladenosine(37)-C(2))-methylthiotransferase MtaB [Candidatus Izimaplasma bacterium ZiA1]
MKIAFHTLGCKVNTYETESISKLFTDNGYVRVKDNEFADVYVINTCTVTNQASSKSRKSIRKLIKMNPEAIIAVMGCYSQVSEEEIAVIEGVDIIIGTTHREHLYELVSRVKRDREKISEVKDVSRYREFDIVNVTNFTENTRAFLKIQDGCNNFCTYCIIPFARGRVRSRKKDEVLNEAIELVKNGYQEIVLTGIHTGAYGVDLDNYSLYYLLKDLADITELKRIRISSIEINELTDEIIDLIASNSKFARHLHIPLQSGSDEILKKMHRKYTKEQFFSKINEIKQKVENIAITTDIIVGFPSESDNNFREMYDFIAKCEFSELHVFPFSKRNGTKAALIKDQINGITKTLRVNELLELNDKLANKYRQLQKKPLSIIFETSDDEYTYGHTTNYLKVAVKKDVTLHNTLKSCLITKYGYPISYGVIA